MLPFFDTLRLPLAGINDEFETPPEVNPACSSIPARLSDPAKSTMFNRLVQDFPSLLKV
jgi:hypothetical protein